MSSFERRDRMNRDTAERLLSGTPAPPTNSAGRRMAGVLAAARGPGRPGELAGEPAVMAAFAAAHLTPLSVNRRPSMIKVAVAKLLTLKAAAVLGVTCAGVTGVALAANAGVLPAPITAHLPGTHHHKAPHPVPSGSARPTPASTAPPAEIAALCRDFAHRGDKAHRTKALQDARFGELVRRAGKPDPDRIAAFCAHLTPGPSARPTGSFPPGVRPGGLPQNRPSGLPSGRPDVHAGHPSGQPGPFPNGPAAPAAGSPE